MTQTSAPSGVALFVTCLVDSFRPSVGFAALRLLRSAGAPANAPSEQTCCGQPAYNSGDRERTKAIARQVIETFADYRQVVVPSGSCGGMLKLHYPELFEGDPIWAPRARAFAGKVVELSQFLLDNDAEITASYDGVAAYHDSCASLREMQVRQQPRDLLAQVDGLTVRDLEQAETCCGFGGLFSVKYPEISTRLTGDKTDDIKARGVDTLVAGDLGCLLNLAGLLKRQGSRIRVYHYAEILAGMTDEPGIGDGA